ncbi:hypothetical protein EH183_36050 [Streptomyces sp. CB01881]|nr:hypothetical protein C2142_35990 [Streptomyces sp. CB01881]TYC69555.1 hypothetical protein EH183_36050 [Streptomyces sp. CB01881]
MRPGRPRTTTSPGAGYGRRSPRPTCSPACAPGSRADEASQRDGPWRSPELPEPPETPELPELPETPEPPEPPGPAGLAVPAGPVRPSGLDGSRRRVSTARRRGRSSRGRSASGCGW